MLEGMDSLQFSHDSYERGIRESVKEILSIFSRPEHGYMPKINATMQLVEIHELLKEAAQIAKRRAL